MLMAGHDDDDDDDDLITKIQFNISYLFALS